MTKIALCIPVMGEPTWALFDSFGQWQSYHYSQMDLHPETTVTVLRPPRPLPVDVARTFLAAQVLDGDYDYLWFTDQDAAYLAPTLDRLLAWDVPIVGARCFIRAAPWCAPMVFKGQKPDDPRAYQISVDEVYNYLRLYAEVETNMPQCLEPIPPDSLYPCDITGCHCVLIKREVLEALEPPWFSGLPGREDMYFYEQAKQAGFQLHVDFSTIAGHATGSRIIGVYDYMAHYLYQSLLEGVDVGIANRTTENP